MRLKLLTILCSWYNLLNNCGCFILDKGAGSGSGALPALAESPLRIASFNIQVFGQTKYSHTDVVTTLLKILSRYDVIQILEIRDSQQTVFERLRKDLNAFMALHGDNAVYEKVVSTRLGSTSIKEQYGYLYRQSRVSVVSTYQYPDIHHYFERPPFGVRFKSPSTVIQDFALVASHIRPSMALEEMDNLTKVYESFQRHWHLSNIMISGDFNADCNYLRVGDWKNITFRSDSRFWWLIDDNTDTTVSASSCSYDRFVVGGDALYDAVVPGSVQVYRFDEQLRMTTAEALKVSDHFPIQLELAGHANIATQRNIETSVSFTVKDVHPVSNINNIRNIYHSPSCADSAFTIKLQRENTHMDFVTAHATVVDSDHVMPLLQSFRSSCQGTLSLELLAMVNGYMQSNHLKTDLPNVYGLILNLKKHVYETEIMCSIVTPNICKVTVSRVLSGV